MLMNAGRGATHSRKQAKVKGVEHKLAILLFFSAVIVLRVD